MSSARVALVTVGAAIVLSACGVTASDVQSGEGQGFVGGDGAAQVIDQPDRLPAPEIAGTTLDGQPLALGDLRDDVVVVNVWGSWCAPCRAEAETLQQVYRDHRSDGVAFVGLNTRDQQAAALAFEERFGITYPSLVDESGELQLAFRDSLPPNAIPSTLVIDRHGDIAARVVGPTTYSQLSKLVADVAAEP